MMFPLILPSGRRRPARSGGKRTVGRSGAAAPGGSPQDGQ